jgi:hypothetical protein
MGRLPRELLEVSAIWYKTPRLCANHCGFAAAPADSEAKNSCFSLYF